MWLKVEGDLKYKYSEDYLEDHCREGTMCLEGPPFFWQEVLHFSVNVPVTKHYLS